MKNLITLSSVSLRYGHVLALHDVSASFQEGSLTALAGPNGAGKSTLLKAIAGILKPRAGSIEIEHEAEHHTAYLPQSAALQKDYPFSVLQTVLIGAWPDVGSFGALTADHVARARAALAKVGMEGLEKRQISTLSGGQFQRMLFARVMMQEPRLILLDEPFTGVDAETTRKLMQILLHWHREGRTVLCVLHDLRLIRAAFPETMLLSGRLVAMGQTESLFKRGLLSDSFEAELLS